MVLVVLLARLHVALKGLSIRSNMFRSLIEMKTQELRNDGRISEATRLSVCSINGHSSAVTRDFYLLEDRKRDVKNVEEFCSLLVPASQAATVSPTLTDPLHKRSRPGSFQEFLRAESPQLLPQHSSASTSLQARSRHGSYQEGSPAESFRKFARTRDSNRISTTISESRRLSPQPRQQPADYQPQQQRWGRSRPHTLPQSEQEDRSAWGEVRSTTLREDSSAWGDDRSYTPREDRFAWDADRSNTPRGIALMTQQQPSRHEDSFARDRDLQRASAMSTTLTDHRLDCVTVISARQPRQRAVVQAQIGRSAWGRDHPQRNKVDGERVAWSDSEIRYIKQFLQNYTENITNQQLNPQELRTLTVSRYC